MTSDDYKSVDIVKGALGSIARLGRAAAVHLALACQRASGSTISTDLKNNIQMSCLLGGFDDGASQLMFEKDISQLAKPAIKGRGFIGSGQEIIETQTYYTVPEKDWEFDEDQLLTYNNPVFVEQCKLRNKDFDELNAGWIPQKPIGEIEDELDEEEDDDEDDEITDEEEEFLFASKSNKSSNNNSKDKLDNKSEVSDEKSKKDSKDKPEPPTPEKPDVSIEDLDDLFGFDDDTNDNSSSEEVPPSISSSSESEVTMSTRDKVTSAIDSQVVSKPKIKLNIDPTKVPQAKPKIKLNFKKEE